MKVNRSAAVSLLVALGTAMAGKWNKTKLLGRLKKIDELVDEDTKLEDDDATFLKKLQAANEAEEDLEIEDDSDDDEKPKKKAKKGDSDDDEKPKKKKGKRPTTAAKPDAPRDAYGNREGTQAAAINAVMTKKSQTVKDIAEASGFNGGRVKGHLAFLIEHGFAEKTEKGYRLTGKTKASAKKADKAEKAEKNKGKAKAEKEDEGEDDDEE